MIFLTFILFLFLGYSTADEEVLLRKCSRDDIECLQKAGAELLAKAAAGLGEPHNIKPVDPIIIPSIESPMCCDNPPKIAYLSNIKIMGVKDIKLVDTTTDETLKTVLTVTADLKISTDLATDKAAGAETGKLEATTKTKNTVTYVTEIKKDDSGVSHYEIGPETITCEVTGDTVLSFDAALLRLMENDPSLRASLQPTTDEAIKAKNDFACALSKIGIARATDATRQATRRWPVAS